MRNNVAASLAVGLHSAVGLDFYILPSVDEKTQTSIKTNESGPSALLFWTDIADNKIYRGKLAGQGNKSGSLVTFVNQGCSFVTFFN